jgi:hypothetical protein
MLRPHLAATVGAARALQQLTARACAAEGTGVSDAEAWQAVKQLMKQLCTLGLVSDTFVPVTSACNNPTCSNISGPSEAGLVKGSSDTCGGCSVARYCCKACHTQHWKLHELVCKTLAAERAGGES